jgi:hypothetical protein
VWLASRAAYSSIAQCQWGSARAARTEEGTGEAPGGAFAVSIFFSKNAGGLRFRYILRREREKGLRDPKTQQHTPYGAGKGKNIFVKNNMMRDDDAVGEEIKAVVPLMVRRVTKEKTVSGARR